MSGIKGGKYFSRVKEARELLKERAREILDRQERMIEQAAARGQMTAALQANQWLLEHIPADEGERVIDASPDKPTLIDAKPTGPLVQIGFNLGGMVAPKQIEPIEAEVIKPKELVEGTHEAIQEEPESVPAEKDS